MPTGGELCYDNPMRSSDLEPGVLSVFRLFAWLQLISLLILPPLILFDRVSTELYSDLAIQGLYTAGYALALLVLMYLPVFQKWLGRSFLPFSLIVAVVGLLAGNHWLGVRGLFFQTYPFLMILLILTAWQYRYRVVVLFSLGVLLAELTINMLLPGPTPFRVLLNDRSDSRVNERTVGYVFLTANAAAYLVLGYAVNTLADAQRRQRRALADANRKLVSHADALEQLAVTRERVRISRELHDTLAHTLSAETVQVEALLSLDSLPPKGRAMLERMQDTIQTGLNDTRRTLSALRASALEELGLAGALKAYSRDFATRHNLVLDLGIPDSLDDLPAEVEQTTYRVAQEALENAARHADAHKVTVRLFQRGAGIELLISDDGRGFDPRLAVDQDGFGILGMRERAALVGADLDINSQPGGGTTVMLNWEPGP
jgi:signal transduction histidine kinase